jgi:hypothetical protein
LSNKPRIYASIGVPEFILVDVTGEFMPEKLKLRRLQADNCCWVDEQDADGGVTSQLGFRLNIDSDGMIRMFDAETRDGYPRPEEMYLLRKARLQNRNNP